jgi:hypothetical protein
MLRAAGISSPAAMPIGPSPLATSRSAAKPWICTAPHSAAERRPALGQQGAADAGKDIAAAGRGQPRIAAGIDAPLAVGGGDHGAAALERDMGLEAPGQRQRGLDAVCLHVVGGDAEQARRFGGVGGEQGGCRGGV